MRARNYARAGEEVKAQAVESVPAMLDDLQEAAFAREREACALKADDAYCLISDDKSYERGWKQACRHIAAEIRARGKK